MQNIQVQLIRPPVMVRPGPSRLEGGRGLLGSRFRCLCQSRRSFSFYCLLFLPIAACSRHCLRSIQGQVLRVELSPSVPLRCPGYQRLSSSACSRCPGSSALLPRGYRRQPVVQSSRRGPESNIAKRDRPEEPSGTSGHRHRRSTTSRRFSLRNFNGIPFAIEIKKSLVPKLLRMGRAQWTPPAQQLAPHIHRPPPNSSPMCGRFAQVASRRDDHLVDAKVTQHTRRIRGSPACGRDTSQRERRKVPAAA